MSVMSAARACNDFRRLCHMEHAQVVGAGQMGRGCFPAIPPGFWRRRHRDLTARPGPVPEWDQ